MATNFNQTIAMDGNDIWGKCPKCDDGKMHFRVCSKCGLIFRKYYDIQNRKKMSVSQRAKKNQSLFTIGKQFGRFAWMSMISLVASVSLFFIVQGTNSLANEKKVSSLSAAFNMPAVTTGSVNQSQQLIPVLHKGKESFQEGLRLSRGRDFEGATQKFEHALVDMEELDNPRLIALTSLNLAICYQVLDKYRDALFHFESTLDLSRENGFETYEAKALQGMGSIYQSMGQDERALAYLDEALEIHKATNDKKGLALDWLIKGIIEESREDASAGDHFRLALEIAEQMGDPLMIVKARRLLHNWLDQNPQGENVNI